MSQKKYTSLDTLSYFYDKLKDVFSSVTHSHTVSDITDYTVDTELSDQSTNPVSNQAIKTEFDVVNADLEARTTVGVAGEVLYDGEIDLVYADHFSCYAKDEPVVPVEAGKTYSVTLDGLEYACECRVADNGGMTSFIIGNTEVSGSFFGDFVDEYNSGEPFAYVYTPSDNRVPAAWLAKSDFATLTVSTAGTSTPVTEAVTSLEVRVDALEDADAALKTEFDVVKDSIVQSDWNENDETSNAYVKNRTHYEESAEVKHIDNQTLTFNLNMGGQVFASLLGPEIVEGKEYTVIWEGTAYSCVAYAPTNMYDTVGIGNGTIYGQDNGSHGNGEPFFIYRNIDSEYWAFFTETAGSYTITVSSIENVVHALDAKYLPVAMKPGEGNGAVVFGNTELNVASGEFAAAFGGGTEASGTRSHAEGRNTVASGDHAHAEGLSSSAEGNSSHAEGESTTASGSYSHAEGKSTTASKDATHAEGYYTLASSKYQHVQGKYNVEDAADTYAHIVGNGTTSLKRSNAHTLDWSGNAWYAGTIKLGGTSYDDASEVALKSDFESLESSLSNGDVVVSEATHAISADSATTATNAGHATTADSATSATSATKATQDAAGNVIVDFYETKDDASTKLSEAKTYADTAVANLVNSAPETLDTLGELATAFQENEDVVATLNDAITTKADKSEIVQSDWNVNDETSMAYVKNRPFYSNGMVEKTIVEEQTVTLEDMGGLYGTQMAGVFDIKDGLEYTVSWQGQEYVLTCASMEMYGGQYVYLGNPEPFGLEGNDCPFLIASVTNYGMSMIVGEAAGDYTVKVTTIEEDVVRMPVKYLPEGYPYVGEPVETTLVDNVSFTVSSAGGSANNPFELEIQVDSTYLVTWNSTDYTVVGSILDGVPVLGNPSIVGFGSDTGEPFLIGANGTNVFVYASEAGTHTISIVGMIPEIHKMDEKFLPEIDIPTDILRYTSQSLTTSQKTQARTNIGAVGYESQSLTTSQKTQARTNIGAVGYESQSLSTAYKTQARTNIGAVGYESQSLTTSQKTQARTNIGAAATTDLANYALKTDLDTLEDTVNTTIENIDMSEYAKTEDLEALKATFDEIVANIDLSEIEAKIYEPKDAIPLIDTVNGYTYLVQMKNGNLISTCGISSIEITSMPNKTEYVAGEYFDPTGMIVTAVYSNGSRAEVVDYSYPTNRLVVDDTQVNISYTNMGIKYTATVDIVVGEFDPSIELVDFTYTANNDGTYTITGWKQTLNGVSSTEMIVPNNSLVKL